ncbi:MAG: hypothetical protein JWO05_748 [Gemmatimonadetes bacterium]|nr:hypothetical protein [Gemmatimonadota bacterium]
MKVVIFGATGMIGQGVLRECLLDEGVERVVAVVRRPTGSLNPKLHELVRADVTDLSAAEGALAALDACFFCLGTTSLGMSEQDYTRVTHDLTLLVARTLMRTSPALTFVYVSGAGSDSSEKGRVMWARVRGRLENALLAMPFKAVYIFRPAAIVPLDGIRSATGWYNTLYAVIRPLFPLIRRFSPGMISNTRQMGRAMLGVVRNGYPKEVLEMKDINSVLG